MVKLKSIYVLNVIYQHDPILQIFFHDKFTLWIALKKSSLNGHIINFFNFHILIVFLSYWHFEVILSLKICMYQFALWVTLSEIILELAIRIISFKKLGH